MLACCAEVAAYLRTGARTVQAAGRSLMPLRCTSVEGGFLGKTLLTLVYGRGGPATDPPPLPTHKLSPHDIVAVRPVSTSGAPKGKDAASAVAAQGVVYKVGDTQIVVAADEVAEGADLDVPLRLDKLANKVRCLAGLTAGLLWQR